MTKHEKEQLGCEAIELAGEKIGYESPLKYPDFVMGVAIVNTLQQVSAAIGFSEAGFS